MERTVMTDDGNAALKHSNGGFSHFGTLAIHGGWELDVNGSVVTGIGTATTFAQSAPGVPNGQYEYARTQNPTKEAYEGALACVEEGKHGMAFSSGLSALATITQLLNVGDHIVSMDDTYGGTRRFFSNVAAKNGIEMSYVDMTVPIKLIPMLKLNTRMIWIETPTNPTLKLINIKEIAAIAHSHNPEIIVVVDNTFMSSFFQRPLNLGADVVMHSVTKYMNGHSDAVIGAAITRSDDLGKRLKYLQNAIGTTPSPFDCYLAHRGLKTLHVRMRQHQANAFAVATFLEENPRVEKVIYPGLKSHPQHELAKQQMSGFGGMLSFYIRGDRFTTTRFLQELKVFTLAESLGAVESLVEVPSLMTHHHFTPEVRAHLNITHNLVRTSVGIEDVEDLIHDLRQALEKAVVL
eukprot:CFRG2353T1